MKKLNWSKIGAGLYETLQNVAPPLLGGAGMICLSLICKKLNVPYQVLLDPSYSSPQRVVRSNPMTLPTMMAMTDNSTEMAIYAIYDGIKSQSSDYYKANAADQIFNLLGDSELPITEQTKKYAILCLNNISRSMRNGYYQNCVTDLVAKIAKGDY